ncbi:MAG: Yip1 family protein [bacterium]
MNSNAQGKKNMNVFEKIVGIFSSPKETFVAINEKPTWLIPFIIIVIVATVSQFLLMDITFSDQIEAMKARGMNSEQIQAAQKSMQGPIKYIGFIAAPIFILLAWLILSGIFLFTGNTIMGGRAQFKNVLAVVSWSGLIGIVQSALQTYLVISNGTSFGVTTSLAILLPTPQLGEDKTVLYRLLSRFDIFTFWTLILWIIGLAVVYKFSTKKSATMVLSLWAIYIVLVVAIGSLLGGVFGM